MATLKDWLADDLGEAAVGFALFLGASFAPLEDRAARGRGFPHNVGDRARVSTPRLHVRENEVTLCPLAPAWTFGVSQLMRNLARRRLLEHRSKGQ